MVTLSSKGEGTLRTGGEPAPEETGFSRGPTDSLGVPGYESAHDF